MNRGGFRVFCEHLTASASPQKTSLFFDSGIKAVFGWRPAVAVTV
jgi:hypothetical protein